MAMGWVAEGEMYVQIQMDKSQGHERRRGGHRWMLKWSTLSNIESLEGVSKSCGNTHSTMFRASAGNVTFGR